MRPAAWFRAAAEGLYRSAVLTFLTGVVPAVAVATAFFGSEFAFSWTSALSAPLAVRLLAAAGELAMGLVWASVAAWFAFLLVGRKLSQVARRAAGSWLGLRLEASYQALPPVTRMATGYWWNGYEYHKSEREARRRATVASRSRDPQAHRDALWFLAAAVTVLPAATAPLVAVGVGAYVMWLTAYGAVIIVAGLAMAPVAWRPFGPVAARFLGPGPDARIEELEAIRADLTHTQAAELERIERGLHDGAQARLVALGMSMGAAERLVDSDPAAVREILAEARASSVTALAELRELVRGISPPVLAERGLTDAVRALALDAPVRVTVRGTVPSRPERPVEAAVYFAVAELLTNVAKHARATAATVDLGYRDRMLTATVTDDGSGGAAAAGGSGLNGIERRMAAFGGSLRIESPVGGPTSVTVAVPCALS